MDSEVQLELLSSQRKALKQAIRDEEHRPHPDDLVLHDLKKQKLALKDQIHDIEQHV
jgi:hypothetical protein